MKAWIYQRGESHYVGWRDILGRRNGRSFGPGEEGRLRAKEYKAALNAERAAVLFDSTSKTKIGRRVQGLSKEEVANFNGMSVVYFIEAVGLDRVKIGTSVKLSRRLRAIQTYCPVRTRVLLVVAGDPKLESRLHRRFRTFRLHGEWFQLSVSLSNTIVRLKRSLKQFGPARNQKTPDNGEEKEKL